MCKPLRSYHEKDRREIAMDRLARKTGGLGYLAAQDYVERIRTAVKVAK